MNDDVLIQSSPLAIQQPFTPTRTMHSMPSYVPVARITSTILPETISTQLNTSPISMSTLTVENGTSMARLPA